MIPHTLVLKPGLVIHSIYNGYWFWGRPSVDDLWHDLRAASSEIRPDWDLSTPGLREAWDAGDRSPFHGCRRGAPQRARAPAEPEELGQPRRAAGRRRRRCGPRRACRPDPARRRRPRPPAAAPSLPQRTTLYSSAHERPSSITAQCSSGMPPPFENSQLVERAQTVAASVHVPAARGLAGVAVRFECRHDRVDVARRERALVVAHDVRTRAAPDRAAAAADGSRGGRRAASC